MGIKIVLKGGTTHKFYNIAEIAEIIIYGPYSSESAGETIEHKSITKIKLEGMN